MLNEKILFDLGWQPLGRLFARSQVYCSLFQTLASCGTLEFNNFNWQNWPFAQRGGTVRFQPAPEYQVSAGVFQVNPIHKTEGFDLTFVATSVIVAFELGWFPGQGDRRMPGEYKLGGYYHSSPTPDVFLDVNGLSAGLTGSPFAGRDGRSGVYALGTQMVYRERPKAKRGLSLFGFWTASDPTTETFRFFYAGAFCATAAGVHHSDQAHRSRDGSPDAHGSRDEQQGNASAIGPAEATVKVHVVHILAMLDVDDRTKAVTVALKRGIFRLDDSR